MSKPRPLVNASGVDVYAKGFLLTAKANELMRRLEQTYQTLTSIEQADTDAPASSSSALPPGLDNIAAQLVNTSLVRSSSKDVQLLVACCLVEILRIFAPTPPYNSGQLKNIFDLLAQQFAFLGKSEGNEAAYEHAFHIVESLATVRSCCILSELAQDGDGNGESDTQINLVFQSLLECVSPGAPKKLEDYIAEIISSVLEELSGVTISTLEGLLSYLLDQVSAYALHAQSESVMRDLVQEHIRATGIVVAVLKRCEEKLVAPIAQAINHFISVAQGSDGSDSGPFGKMEAIHKVILKIVEAAPSVLLLTLPTLSRDLEADDATVRLSAVVMVGDIFSLPTSICTADGGLSGRMPIARAYDVHFQAWIKRFRDKDPAIREVMCRLCARLLQAHPSLSSVLLTELVPRIGDQHNAVRERAVITVCDAACNSLQSTSADVLHAVALRTKDKILNIRKEAATGLAQVYAAHMPSIWTRQPGSDGDFGAIACVLATPDYGCEKAPALTDGDASVVSLLEWIPTCVVECLDHPEAEMKQRVAQLLDTVMLPSTLSMPLRAIGMASLYSSLAEPAIAAWERMLQDRSAMQKTVTEFLRARANLKAAENGGRTDAESGNKLKQLRDAVTNSITAVAERSAPTCKPVAQLQLLASGVPDNRVFKQLAVLADPATPSMEIAKARDDLLQRLKAMVAAAVESRTNSAEFKAMAEIVKLLMKRIAMTTVSSDVLQHVIYHAARSYRCKGMDGCTASLRLLVSMSKHFPGMFSSWASVNTTSPCPAVVLCSMLLSQRNAVLVPTLQILGNLGYEIFQEACPVAVRNATRHILVAFATKGHPNIAKLATRAGSRIFAQNTQSDYEDAFFVRIAEELRAEVDGEPVLLCGKRTCALLSCAQALALHAPLFLQQLDGPHDATSPAGSLPKDVFAGCISGVALQLFRQNPNEDADGAPEGEHSGSKRKRAVNQQGTKSKRGAAVSEDEVVLDEFDPETVQDTPKTTSLYGVAISQAACRRVAAIKFLTSICRGISLLYDHQRGAAAEDLQAGFVCSAKAAAMLMLELLERGGNFFGAADRAHTLPTHAFRVDDVGATATTTPSRSTAALDAVSSSRRSQSSHKSFQEDEEDATFALSPTDSAALRCTAAVCLVRIASSSLGKMFDNRVVSPVVFRWLSTGLIDEQFFARSSLFRVLRNKIALGKLAFRYMALPMLAALEPKAPHRKLIKDAYPGIFDMYRRAGSASQTSFSIMPEYILPFCIFLLAHDDARFPGAQAVKTFWKARRSMLETAADAGDRKEDFGPLQEQALCLTFVCDALITSLPVSTGSSISSSLSLMFAILRKIKDCEDAVDASRTYAVHAVADLAFLVLKRYAKESAAYAEYPGEIRLPASLFSPGTAGELHASSRVTKGVRATSPARMGSVSTQVSSRHDSPVLQAASSTNSTIPVPRKEKGGLSSFETPVLVKSAKGRGSRKV